MAKPRLEFISPFPVEACIKRLEGRHEEGTWWAWRGQTRIWVKVSRYNQHTYMFEIKRVAKSAMTLPMSMFILRGYLRPLDTHQTAVVAYTSTAWLMLIFSSVLLGIAFDLMAALWVFPTATGAYQAQTFSASQIGLMAVLMPLLSGIALILQQMYGDSHYKEFSGMVQEALGGLGSFMPN